MRIRIKLDGVKEVTRNLKGIKNKVSNLTPSWKKIANDFRETEKKVFRGQGAYGSRPRWKPLTPQYRIQKAKTYPGKPILQRTGTLMRSLTSKGQGHVEIIRPKSITLGTSDPKFGFHQKGTRKMVARPPITFTNYQAIKWSKIIRDDILKGDRR